MAPARHCLGCDALVTIQLDKKKQERGSAKTEQRNETLCVLCVSAHYYMKFVLIY